MIDANKEGNSCIDLSRNSAFLQKENRAPEQETSVDIKSMVNCSIFAVTDMIIWGRSDQVNYYT